MKKSVFLIILMLQTVNAGANEAIQSSQQKLLNSATSKNQSESIIPKAINNMVAITKSWQTFHGEFEQLSYSETGELVERSQGEASMQLPALIRWHVKAPYEQIIIANQAVLYSYDVELEQINLQSIDEYVVNTPAKLLTLKPEQINQQFSVMQMTDGSEEIFTLRPKAAESMYDVMQLTFEHQQLKVISLLDSLGQRSEVKFSKTETNINIEPRLFEMVRPEGVDVIDSTEG